LLAPLHPFPEITGLVCDDPHEAVHSVQRGLCDGQRQHHDQQLGERPMSSISHSLWTLAHYRWLHHNHRRISPARDEAEEMTAVNYVRVGAALLAGACWLKSASVKRTRIQAGLEA